MAKKPFFLFSGKESPKEEKAEKKVGKTAYKRGEAKEGEGKPMMACGGKVKKMATGGSVRGTGAAVRGTGFGKNG